MAAVAWSTYMVVLFVGYVYGYDYNYHGASVSWRVLEDKFDGELKIKATFRTSFSDMCYYVPYYDCYGTSIGTCTRLVNSSDICQDKDTDDGWQTSETTQTFSRSVRDQSVYRETWSSYWVSSYGAGRYAYIPFLMDLQIREDLQKPNNSPQVQQLPLTKFLYGCPATLQIAVYDEDGDHVTCKYGTSSDTGVSNSYPYFVLDEELCQLSYNGGGSETNVAVTIFAEDHPQDDKEKVLSYVPFQFIVQITHSPSTSACYDKPFFISPTPDHLTKFVAVSDAQFSLTLHAQTSAWKYSNQIERFSVVGPGHLSNQGALEDLGNEEFRTTFTWTPRSDDKGSHLACFTAKDNNGMLSDQTCVIINVDGSCEDTAGGCSDTCETLESHQYICTCKRSCWELAEDEQTCIPKIQPTCEEGRIKVKVEKCAVDGDVFIGNYDEDNVPAQCVPTGVTDTHYVFDISPGECQTTAHDSGIDMLQKITVKMYIEDPQRDHSADGSSDILRGTWYVVNTYCGVQQYFNVSGEFDPDDSSSVVVNEDGFGKVEVSFDFYTDSTFQTAHSPYDYPIPYELNDDIYFGIIAQAEETGNIELKTVSCQAVPSTNLDSTSSHVMIDDGCIIDETMKQYPTSVAYKNQYSIQAFRFANDMPGITKDTNVVIQCVVVVCIETAAGTTCDNLCVPSGDGETRYYDDTGKTMRVNLIDRRRFQNEGRIAKQDDESTPGETDPISPQSRPFNIAVEDSEDTEDGRGGQSGLRSNIISLTVVIISCFQMHLVL